MPPSESPYVDVPLNLGRKNIRLVTLEDGDASESIKCNLQSHALDDECPAYVALSYAWGAKERYDDIQINGSSFPVGRNLWHFLNQMRMQGQDVILWIDAISIDQANVLEQNHQVQMMREIYTQACCVWVWLGEADDATMSDVAMQYLETRVALNGKDFNPKKLWNARKAKAILRLCEKEYWRRIWIVQEVLLAKEVKILCGGRCVQWIKLQQLLIDLQAISDRGRSLHVVGAPAVLDSPAAVIIRAKARWNGDPQPLTLLLEQYHRQHSTDVRDKVYALHGLASDSRAISINYRIDPKELFVQIVQHACSSVASKIDMKRSRKSLLDFAKLMRESLKVFCDDEELIYHISVAQWKSCNALVHQTPGWNYKYEISNLHVPDWNPQLPCYPATRKAEGPFAVGDIDEMDSYTSFLRGSRISAPSGPEETNTFLDAGPQLLSHSIFRTSAQAVGNDSGESARRRYLEKRRETFRRLFRERLRRRCLRDLDAG